MASHEDTAVVSAAAVDNAKRLTELKVADLRNELEKRGKDKTGVKSLLVERLTMVRTLHK
jgi:hypothetical protein